MYRRDFPGDFIPAPRKKVPKLELTKLETVEDWEILKSYQELDWMTPGELNFECA